jgi:hypothetical protein
MRKKLGREHRRRLIHHTYKITENRRRGLRQDRQGMERNTVERREVNESLKGI